MHSHSFIVRVAEPVGTVLTGLVEYVRTGERQRFVGGEGLLAILTGLPDDVKELTVQDEKFQLPVVGPSTGRKIREAQFKLVVGQTNHLSLKLEPKNRSFISHY